MSEYEYTNQWVEETNVDIRAAIGVRLIVTCIALGGLLYAWKQKNIWMGIVTLIIGYKALLSFLNWTSVIFR